MRPSWRRLALAASFSLLVSGDTLGAVDDSIFFTIRAPKLSAALIQLSQQR